MIFSPFCPYSEPVLAIFPFHQKSIFAEILPLSVNNLYQRYLNTKTTFYPKYHRKWLQISFFEHFSIRSNFHFNLILFRNDHKILFLNDQIWYPEILMKLAALGAELEQNGAQVWVFETDYELFSTIFPFCNIFSSLVTPQKNM